MSSDSLVFGFYGKVPSTGDFVSRGLEQPRLSVIDGWFQHGLMELFRRDANWLESYLVAPVWNFLVPAGQWGKRAQCGALMASVDRVGRYFPLVVLAEVGVMGVDWRSLAHLHALTATIPSVLQEFLSPDEFADRLRGLVGSVELTPVRPVVLERFEPEGHLSAWWANRGSDRPYLQLSHRGMPDSDLFCQLFASSDRG